MPLTIGSEGFCLLDPGEEVVSEGESGGGDGDDA